MTIVSHIKMNYHDQSFQDDLWQFENTFLKHSVRLAERIYHRVFLPIYVDIK